MKKAHLLLVGCLTLVVLLAICSTGILFAADSDELVNGRFVKTKRITVEVYDAQCYGSRQKTTFTDFIKKDCCVITTSKSVSFRSLVGRRSKC